jgi:hypothetical protein
MLYHEVLKNNKKSLQQTEKSLQLIMSFYDMVF